MRAMTEPMWGRLTSLSRSAENGEVGQSTIVAHMPSFEALERRGLVRIEWIAEGGGGLMAGRWRVSMTALGAEIVADPRVAKKHGITVSRDVLVVAAKERRRRRRYGPGCRTDPYFR